MCIRDRNTKECHVIDWEVYNVNGHLRFIVKFNMNCFVHPLLFEKVFNHLYVDIWHDRSNVFRIKKSEPNYSIKCNVAYDRVNF